MDTYKIVLKKQTEDMVFTDVEFDFDGVKVLVNIPHFRPQSAADIILGIENRMMSERSKLDAAVICSKVLASLG